MKKLVVCLVALAAIALLQACGGGSGSSNGSNVSNTYDVLSKGPVYGLSSIIEYVPNSKPCDSSNNTCTNKFMLAPQFNSMQIMESSKIQDKDFKYTSNNGLVACPECIDNDQDVDRYIDLKTGLVVTTIDNEQTAEQNGDGIIIRKNSEHQYTENTENKTVKMKSDVIGFRFISEDLSGKSVRDFFDHQAEVRANEDEYRYSKPVIKDLKKLTQNAIDLSFAQGSKVYKSIYSEYDDYSLNGVVDVATLSDLDGKFARLQSKINSTMYDYGKIKINEAKQTVTRERVGGKVFEAKYTVVTIKKATIYRFHDSDLDEDLFIAQVEDKAGNVQVVYGYFYEKREGQSQLYGFNQDAMDGIKTFLDGMGQLPREIEVQVN